jgi:cardiolipin synthase
MLIVIAATVIVALAMVMLAMNNLAASREVSKPETTAKPYAPRGGESDPERLKWYNLARLNNRTHRKLLVVDGRIGFTAGVGIAGLWTGHAQDPDHWRDSHYSVAGPAAAEMQAVFMDNWVKTTGKVLHGEDYFPAVPPVGNGAAQVFSSSPTGGSESMKLMYMLAVTAAKRSINLSSAYFVPDALSLDALVEAVKRGVKVRIITPGGHMDQETVRRASRARWGRAAGGRGGDL